ncbi:hypothetical protein HMPREF9103_02564, partial [Lentilactobacillus parafarraginis F0439]
FRQYNSRIKNKEVETIDTFVLTSLSVPKLAMIVHHQKLIRPGADIQT